MSRPQDGRRISIDEAVEAVVAEAAGAAMKKAADEVEHKLDSATKAAKETTEDLEAATADAHKAVARGGSAIRQLSQLVWAVACMPLFSAIADPVAALLQGSSVDAVPTIAKLTGALAPLAGLFLVRWVKKTNGSNGLGLHGNDDAGSS